MVKMTPPGKKKSDPVDVLPQSVDTMKRKGWKVVDDNPVQPKPTKDDEKVKNDGKP